MTPGRLFAYGRPRTLADGSRAPRACTQGSCRSGSRRAPRQSTSRVNRAAALAAIGLGQAAIRALQQPDSAAIEDDLRWLHAAANRSLVTWGSAEYPPLLAQIPDAPLVLYVEGDADGALPAATRDRRQPQSDGPRPRHRHAIRAAPGASRARHHQRAGARHRRRRASRRLERGRAHRRGAWVAAWMRSIPGRTRRSRGRSSTGKAPSSPTWPIGTPPLKQQFSAPQQDPQRPGRRDARGRGGPAERVTDHGPPGRRPGARGLRHSRVHPQPAWSADATGCCARAPGWSRAWTTYSPNSNAIIGEISRIAQEKPPAGG